ncbi:fumarylacetoacetase [Pusillimonas sp. DMV24BSW_D]|uniref:fumarylacetoacetase n=1 Tax=Neopusillimonas aestuarii TaxID=2716226 RepID=UPI00140A3D95|nr:fumarylacetoacetase [Pusillimonas sp. DMV24BSW_D]QIM47732.1 fumarylacetoacetase [Pusillimonas sp. DMV24BSW_D]
MTTTGPQPDWRSWVESANSADTHFPIQNLPYGVFSPEPGARPRIGVAIGEHVLDLAVLESEGLLVCDETVFDRPTLNAFIGLGRAAWHDVRGRIATLLRDSESALRDNQALRARCLFPLGGVRMHMPVQVAGYTDFYSSKEHATNVGKLFRDPDNALLPNWSEMPIAYNGRASSVVVSGTPVKRPNGQIKLPDQTRPIFGPCRKLDLELEMGFIVGQDTPLGTPVRCDQAEDFVFGMVLLNDWSARDIQAWEYVPLGPFNAKTFATTISPWVVPFNALEPFRVAQPEQSPAPLKYLQQTGHHAFDIQLQAWLSPHEGNEEELLCQTNFRYLYWSIAQQLAHHTVSGCNVRVGDLMGSGTISGPEPGSYGSLLEITLNGKEPYTLAGGGQRSFIEDGDAIRLTGWCQGKGYRVGFGNCEGTILPAQSL